MPDDDKPARLRIQQQPPADLGLVARLGAKARSAAEALKRATAELDELRAYKTTADAELTKFRSERDPSAVAQRADQLAAELRTLKHRQAFDRIAAESGARPGPAVDDLYQLSGYKAETDAVDEAAIRAAIDGQKAARSYLFGPADGGDGQPVPPGPGSAGGDAGGLKPLADLPAGPGVHRGGSTTKGPQKFTEAQLSDPSFVMKNYAAISAAAKDSVQRASA